MKNDSHIMRARIGDPVKCKSIFDSLLSNHAIFIQPITCPKVPIGTKRLRITRLARCIRPKTATDLSLPCPGPGVEAPSPGQPLPRNRSLHLSEIKAPFDRSW